MFLSHRLATKAVSVSPNLVQTRCKPDVNPITIGFTSSLHRVCIGLGEGDEPLECDEELHPLAPQCASSISMRIEQRRALKEIPAAQLNRELATGAG